MGKPNDSIRFLGDLQRIGLKPGDRFVLSVDKVLTVENVEHIQQAWRNFVGGDAEQMKMLIIDSGMKFGVIGPDAAP